MNKLRILSSAEYDLVQIFSFLADMNTEYAVKVRNRIENSFNTIQEFPQIGKPLELPKRMLVIQDYVILYSLNKETIEINRVLPQRRDYQTHI